MCWHSYDNLWKVGWRSATSISSISSSQPFSQAIFHCSYWKLDPYQLWLDHGGLVIFRDNREQTRVSNGFARSIADIENLEGTKKMPDQLVAFNWCQFFCSESTLHLLMIMPPGKIKITHNSQNILFSSARISYSHPNTWWWLGEPSVTTFLTTLVVLEYLILA